MPAPVQGKYAPQGGVVQFPEFWADSAGYEFWYVPGNADSVTVQAATNIAGLSGFGWTQTALSITEGSGADFMSSADIDPTRIVTDASGDALVSPRIFGEYSHALQAAEFLGYFPNLMTLEWYGRFATASANELTSFVGMTGPAVTDLSAANSGGGFSSNGTNFLFTSDNAARTLALIDTNYHRWKAVYNLAAQTVIPYIDGVAYASVAIETDIWPLCLKMIANTTNRPELAWARVFYS